MSRLSIQFQDDGGVWLSVESQRMSRVLAHSRQGVANPGTGVVEESSEFIAAEQLSVGLQLGGTGSLAILAQAIVAATARSLRIL